MGDSIRQSQPADAAAIVDLSEQKRVQYQAYQPLFWRKAADSREKQTLFLEHQLKRENVIALIHTQGERIDGFVIATLVPAPPVYAAGLTCVIDDYCVLEQRWDAIGKALLDAITQIAGERGAVQVVVVCGNLDEPKREMLRKSGHTIASEWWVKPIV